MLRKNLVYSGRQVNFSVNECVLMCVVCWTCVVVCWHDADAAGLWMQWSTTGWRWKLVTLAAAATSALQWSDLLRFLPTSLLSTSWIGQHLTLHPHTHTLSLSLSLSLSITHTNSKTWWVQIATATSSLTNSYRILVNGYVVHTL